jgi:hypothetical protein
MTREILMPAAILVRAHTVDPLPQRLVSAVG